MNSINSNLPFVICLMGPTASGKTHLAIEIVKQLPCDIISVDSAMVYREMDIGTAKPIAEQQAIAPHRLINICDPKEIYSAGQFCQDAVCEIEDILSRGRIPLLVGGTMLYFHALQHGLSTLPQANPEVRAQLLSQAEQQGWAALHTQLSEIDPTSAARIHPNDPQRISRALEIYFLTGKSLTEIAEQEKTTTFPYRVINIAIAPADRILLHERIEMRFKNMLAQGFVEEVEKLFRRGDLHADLPALRAVGYRQVWDYLENKFSYVEMEQRGIIATRQLAKRQLTWLRGWQGINWYDSESSQFIEQVLRDLDRDNNLLNMS